MRPQLVSATPIEAKHNTEQPEAAVEQVQPSQDHHCHVCLGRTGDHRSICAFIVPNA
jgi:hypothetical protein